MKIRRLTKKSYCDILELVNNSKDFSNFYLTKNNKRIYIRNQILIKQILNDVSKWNEVLWGYYNNDKLVAIALIIGFREKTRRYLRVLYQRESFYILNNLVKFLYYNRAPETFAKINKGNRLLVSVLKKNRFYFKGSRGNEVLLKRDKQKIVKLGDKTNGKDD